MKAVAPKVMGRPTLYDPSYCDVARSFMGKGFSVSALAGELRVDRDTLYEWEKNHSEFRRALKESRVLRVRALEAGLLNNSFAGPQITARIFALKNAMPDEWRDRHEVTGADGGPIAVTVARFVADEPKVIEGEVIAPAAAITDERAANTVLPKAGDD